VQCKKSFKKCFKKCFGHNFFSGGANSSDVVVKNLCLLKHKKNWEYYWDILLYSTAVSGVPLRSREIDFFDNTHVFSDIFIFLDFQNFRADP